MYVCVCNAVTENDVHEAVTRGALTVRDLRSELGITDTCGRCAHCALECLTRARGAAPCHHTACAAECVSV